MANTSPPRVVIPPRPGVGPGHQPERPTAPSHPMAKPPIKDNTMPFQKGNGKSK